MRVFRFIILVGSKRPRLIENQLIIVGFYNLQLDRGRGRIRMKRPNNVLLTGSRSAA